MLSKRILYLVALALCFGYTAAQCPMAKFRQANAGGNAHDADTRGQTESPFHPVAQHMRPPLNTDLSSMDDKPSPRNISQEIFQQTRNRYDKNHLNHMVMQWGQFVDHDITETHAGDGDAYASNIQCDAEDPIFNGKIMKFTRAAGMDDTNRNAISHYIDASNIYGSDIAKQLDLRAVTSTGLSHYLLKMTEGIFYDYDLGPYHLLPTRIEGGSEVFYSGDVRTMEQPGLTALHTLFAREHNRLAKLAKEDLFPGRDDADLAENELNQVFEEARVVVESEMQKITYEDWLPAITGRKMMSDTTTNCGDVDPSILTIFSGALFRFGHTMVNELFWRFQVKPRRWKVMTGDARRRDLETVLKDEAVKPILVEQEGGDGGGGTDDKVEFSGFKAHRKGHLKLSGEWTENHRPAFFDSVNVFLQTEMDIDPLLTGLLLQPNQRIDTQIVPSLREHLFRKNPDTVLVNDIYTDAFDLVALNIQRGRDLGVGNYIQVREALTGFKVTKWSQISSKGAIRRALKKVYGNGRAGMAKVDLFVGMLAEDHVTGSSVGSTLLAGLELQFSRLQRGDCLWYTKRLAEDLTCSTALREEKEALLNGVRTLADVIVDNTELPVTGFNPFRTRKGQTQAPPIQGAPGGDATTMYEPKNTALMPL